MHGFLFARQGWATRQSAGVFGVPGTSIMRLARLGGAAQLAESRVHAPSRPFVSIANVARVALPSGISVFSPTWRRGRANQLTTASVSIMALHTSYRPCRTGKAPKDGGFSEPAIKTTELVPGAALSN